MIKIVLLIATFCGAQLAYTQSEPFDSGIEIEKALELKNKEQYKDAIAAFAKIPRYDTNYVRAQYELADTYRADSQYNKGLEHCERVLAIDHLNEWLPETINLKGILLLDLGETAAAIRILDSAIAIYPAFTNLYINKGFGYFSEGKYKEASETFKTGLLINPYSTQLHFNLAMTSYRQGNPVAAYLGLTACLMVDPTSGYFRPAISTLSDIANVTDEIRSHINNRKNALPDAFSTTEEIVLSKIALEKNYKSLLSFDDKIARQLQVIIEKLEYDADDNDFFNQYYVPLFKKMYSEKKFEAMVNYAFSGVDMEQIQRYNKNNKKEIKRIGEDFVSYCNEIRETRELNYQKRQQTISRYIFSQGVLTGKGMLRDGKLSGQWEFYFPAGNIKSAGVLTPNQEKTGTWKFYYPSGKVKSIEENDRASNGIKVTYYYTNGNVQYTASYINDKLDGRKTGFTRQGVIQYVEDYKNDQQHGDEIIYHPSGFEKSRVKYKNGKMEGLFTVYGPNGKKEKEGQYLDGELSGRYVTFFPDGSVLSDQHYEKGALHGMQKSYHRAGKIKTIEHYINGTLNGEYTEYYENGQVHYSCNYIKGVYDGSITFFDKDGVKYSTVTYKNDVAVLAKYFDKSGKEISASAKNGTMQMSIYNGHGLKTAEVAYNEKGLKHGITKYFYQSGKLSEESRYKEGLLNGPMKWYYQNSQLGTLCDYAEGRQTGPYVAYTILGKKYKEGLLIDDEKQGLWKIFDQQGNLDEEVEYVGDQLDGVAKTFWPNGKLKMQSKFKNDHLQYTIQYDTLGRELNRTTLENHTGVYRLVHLNGKTMAEGTYLNGQLHGRYMTYFFDGTVESERYYTNGLSDSICRIYFYGGKPRTTGTYRLHEKSGTWTYYRTNGNIASEERYRNNELVDSVIYYYESGKKSRVINYRHDTRHGLTHEYAEDGKLMYSVRYEDGEPTAYTYLDSASKPVAEIKIKQPTTAIKTYYPNGNLSAEFAFDEGKHNGPDNTYYENGKVQMFSTELFGQSHGPVKRYYPSGKIKLEYNFYDNNIHGIFKEYYESGITKVSAQYYNDENHGPLVKYDEKGKVIETQTYYYGDLISVKK